MRLLRNLLPFLASTGLRIGEAVALSWSDIDFKQGTVTVSKTVNDSNQIQLSPKTETSNRTIDIDKSTLNLLSKWQLEIKKSSSNMENLINLCFFQISMALCLIVDYLEILYLIVLRM